MSAQIHDGPERDQHSPACADGYYESLCDDCRTEIDQQEEQARQDDDVTHG